MDIFKEIFSNPVFSTLFSLSLAGVVGLYIGKIKVFNVSIGITGVLFGGIILSHLGVRFDENLISFIRDFGLVLFVYAVGMQVGNGFFSAFKKSGIMYNLFSIIIVFLNILFVIIIKKVSGIDPAIATGIYCGATTNTPALASASNTISSIGKPELVDFISLGYAITYPGAIFSLILTMILLKNIFKKEYEYDLTRKWTEEKREIVNFTIKVENKNLDGIKIKDIPALDDLKVVITRIKRGDEIFLAYYDSEIKLNDLILVVGERKNLEEFIKIVGTKSPVDIKQHPQRIINTRAVVTNKSLIGKKIFETKIPSFGVIITRVSRADVEFIASDDYVICFGDNLVVVGEEENVKKAVSFIGNSPKDLNHPDIIPIFIGIIAGVIIGIIPISIPFTNVTLKIGLAGGQLISAIIFSNIGNIGKVSWYIPIAGNLMLRELGITMFLASVGLKSGHNFFNMLLDKQGLMLVLYGLIVSFIPVFIVGYIIKRVYKINYLSLCGILSGSMTDPPALAYATSLSDSNLASISYATVYPLTMFLRIISAQMLVLFFYG